jgi:hypothetical protein
MIQTSIRLVVSDSYVRFKNFFFYLIRFNIKIIKADIL